MKNLIRYLNIFFQFAKNNLIREMEYKSNFILQIFISAGWVAMQIVIIEVYFQFTNNIAGWTKPEMFIFLGFFRIIKSFFDTFFRKNLFGVPDSISKGTMDLILTKPIDSLFMSSTRYHLFSEVSNLVLGFVILSYGFYAMNMAPDISIVITTFLMIVCGIAMYYSLFASFAIIAFFSTRLTAIHELSEILSQTLRFPMNVLTGKNRTAMALLLPFFFVATIPVEIIIQRINIYFIIAECIAAALSLIIVYKFWNVAIKRYSSASS